MECERRSVIGQREGKSDAALAHVSTVVLATAADETLRATAANDTGCEVVKGAGHLLCVRVCQPEQRAHRTVEASDLLL